VLPEYRGDFVPNLEVALASSLVQVKRYRVARIRGDPKAQEKVNDYSN
jgi:hypothetical protein